MSKDKQVIEISSDNEEEKEEENNQQYRPKKKYMRIKKSTVNEKKIPSTTTTHNQSIETSRSSSNDNNNSSNNNNITINPNKREKVKTTIKCGITVLKKIDRNRTNLIRKCIVINSKIIAIMFRIRHYKILETINHFVSLKEFSKYICDHEFIIRFYQQILNNNVSNKYVKGSNKESEEYAKNLYNQFSHKMENINLLNEDATNYKSNIINHLKYNVFSYTYRLIYNYIINQQILHGDFKNIKKKDIKVITKNFLKKTNQYRELIEDDIQSEEDEELNKIDEEDEKYSLSFSNTSYEYVLNEFKQYFKNQVINNNQVFNRFLRKEITSSDPEAIANQLIVFYNINRIIEENHDYWMNFDYQVDDDKTISLCKTFTLIPTPTLKPKCITFNKSGIGAIYNINNQQSESNNSQPIEDFINLSRVSLNGRKGNRYKITTLSTNSVEVNLTLENKELKQKKDERKSRANKKMNKRQSISSSSSYSISQTKSKSKKSSKKSKKSNKDRSDFYKEYTTKLKEERKKNNEQKLHPDDLYHQIAKKHNFTLNTISEFDNAGLTKLPNVNINENEMNQFEFSSIDPGKVVICSASFQFKKENDHTKNHSLNLTSKEYYSRTNMKKNQRYMEKLKKKNNINDIENAYSSPKTTKIEQFNNHLQSFIENINKIAEFYSKRKFIRNNLQNKMRKESILDDFSNTLRANLLYGQPTPKAKDRYSNVEKHNIYHYYSKQKRKNKLRYSNKEKYLQGEVIEEEKQKRKNNDEGSNNRKIINKNKISPYNFMENKNFEQMKKVPLIFFGGATIKDVKSKNSTPNKKILQKLYQKLNVISVNENKTSQICNGCLENGIVKMKDQNGSSINGIIHCKNENCTVNTISRDLNSSLNILKIGTEFFKDKKRLKCFC